MVTRYAALCLIMLLSTLSMALAPAAGNGATLQVICGVDGAETVMLDALGQPVDPANHCDCPNCIGCSSWTAAPPPATAWHGPTANAQPLAATAGAAQTCPQPAYTRPIARGPPAGKGKYNV
jgi:hypothetical protein